MSEITEHWFEEDDQRATQVEIVRDSDKYRRAGDLFFGDWFRRSHDESIYLVLTASAIHKCLTVFQFGSNDRRTVPFEEMVEPIRKVTIRLE